MARNKPPVELSSFKRLNHKTYLWTPPPSAKRNNNGSVTNQISMPSTAGTPPDLILIGSWMNASPRHIAKFTEYYQLIYPSSPILLLTSSTSDFFFNTASKEATDYEPAVATVRAYVDNWSAYCQDHSTPGERGGLLVHGFSNGGGGQVAFLAEHYKAATSHPLPAAAVILDSLPGRSRFRVGIRTLSFGLPMAWYVRWPMQLAFAVLLAVFFQIPHALGRQTLATRLWNDLNAVISGPRLREVKKRGSANEMGAVIRTEAPRCYIYSDVDEFILDHDIEDHADEADAKGLKVKKVKFTGTKHVEHMRADPERYWGAVKGTWDARA
ncbi:hypothetical protein V1517DRAFT_103522 [Lipomyces orientalis]|uniref:Uncharacterized protein n=1 Tax=Lipomyces orientalis TaxID=1233043 RepID=A0ACC3TY46_9ASCO